MSRILKLQALSIASEPIGEGNSTSSRDGCTCSTNSASACKSMDEFVAI